MNPLGKVPFLTSGSLHFPESCAILTYLVHTCPEAGPYQLPSCPRAAAPIISALHCEHASTALA